MKTNKNIKTLVRIVSALILFTIAWLVTEFVAIPVWGEAIVFAAIFLLIGYDVLGRAVNNLFHGRVLDENFLMIVATVGAFGIGDFHEGVAVMLFYQVGELFQSYAVGKSRRSIGAMMDLRPNTARVLKNGKEEEMAPEEVAVGDVLSVRAGERVPVDCVALTEGVLDQAALTGESRPVQCRAGDKLLSGSINTAGTMQARATAIYTDSTVAKILDLVENASDKKAKAENFITKFARWYTPCVVAAAFVLAVLPPLIAGGGWIDWLHRALTFLVVSCPCALVISVPLGFFGGIGGASKAGVLVKGGNYLEMLAKVDTFVFDKTGTLTKGNFVVDGIYPQEKRSEILRAAAIAEQFSNHPLAQSVMREAGEAEEGIDEGWQAEEIAGKGIKASNAKHVILAGNAKLMEDERVDYTPQTEAGSVIYIAYSGVFVGSIVIRDQIKEDAPEAVARLRRMGCKTVMLSGDNERTAQAVAQQVGLDEYHAELLPADKVAALEEILDRKAKGKAVAFVGDGINDAPALMRADVGIAMGGVGSDAAIESADIVLMRDNPSAILTANAVARKTMRIVTENIVFALGVKLLVLVLSAFGLASMWWAVFADVGVAVLAILNAMRAMYLGKKENEKAQPSNASAQSAER